MALSLIIDDGTGLADANTYVALADLATYLESRPHLGAAGTAADAEKNVALVFATRVIDANVTFWGRKATRTQTLAWPRLIRTSLTFWGRPITADPVYSLSGWNNVELQVPEWLDWNWYGLGKPPPQRLKDGVCELAIDILNQDRFAEVAEKGIAELGLGQGALSIKFDPSDRKQALPDMVKALLDPLGTFRGAARGMVALRRAY